MGLDAFSYKLEYLQKKLSKAFMLDFEKKGTALMAQAFAGISLAEHTKQCLLLDILYALTRHPLWIGHPFFIANLEQHAVERYRLERSCLSNLIHNLSRYLEKIAPPPDFEELRDTSESFITYIFVMTLSSKSESNMLEEIGLGHAIFQKISDAIKSYAIVRHGSKDISLMVSDDDLVFHQVIESISKARAKCPWHLDACTLRYLLAAAPAPFGEITWQKGPSSIEALLLNVGKGTIVRLEEAIGFLKERYQQEAGQSTSKLQLQALLDYLEQRGLLATSHYSPICAQESAQKDLVVLTSAGFELTAKHFACEAGAQAVLPEALLSMSGSWQVACLRKHKELVTDPAILMQLLALPLACESIEFLMGLVSPKTFDREQGFFTARLSAGSSLPLRKAFCRAIGKLSDPERVLLFLSPLTKEASCDELRDEALLQLAKLEEGGRETLQAGFSNQAKAKLGSPF